MDAPNTPNPQSTPGKQTGLDPALYGAPVVSLSAGQKVFQRYVLVRKLGQGGMGVVWLAKDEKLDQDVALKFLPDALSHDVGSINELRRETKRSRTLAHPNIIRVYDIEDTDEMTAISMEFVNGASLANRKAWQPHRHFEVKDISTWVQHLCEALDYAHNVAKVIHRDMKPANVLLDELDRVRIADFGIAQTITESMSRISRPTAGTLCYMSPQQAMGEMPTRSDDIYALGATIFDLLAGKPPFYSGDIVAQLVHKKPARMTIRRLELQLEGETIPEVWEQVIAQCLAKKPEERPKSGQEIWERLSAADRPASGYYPTPPRQDYGRSEPVPAPLPPPVQATEPEPPPEPEAVVESPAETPVKSAGPAIKYQPAPAPVFPPQAFVETELEAPAPKSDVIWWVVLIVLLGAVVWFGGTKLGLIKLPGKAKDTNTVATSTTPPTNPPDFKPQPTNEVPPSTTTNPPPIPQPTNEAPVPAPIDPQPIPPPVSRPNPPHPQPTPSPQTPSPSDQVQWPKPPPGIEEWYQQLLLARKLSATTKSNPWTNSLGMIFVPVGAGTNVFFCIWETRVQDFDLFTKAAGVSIPDLDSICDVANSEKGLSWKKPGFQQTPSHPVVGVCWEEASSFCAWLTRWEQAGRLIPANYAYRLPTDLEWSAAVGLPNEPQGSPKERNQQIREIYPWGSEKDPPIDRANYAREEVKDDDRLRFVQRIADYKDTFIFTAPVGSFKANRLGLFDMGGNVWELCQDPWFRVIAPNAVARGGSWADGQEHVLLSSYRLQYATNRRLGNVGFRCVMAINVNR